MAESSHSYPASGEQHNIGKSERSEDGGSICPRAYHRIFRIDNPADTNALRDERVIGKVLKMNVHNQNDAKIITIIYYPRHCELSI